VLRVCEDCGGRFDKEVFEEDFLPEHRGEIAAELDMASLYRAASRSAEAELAMERMVLKSLAEVLHAIGLTPQAVTAELVGTSVESTIAAT